MCVKFVYVKLFYVKFVCVKFVCVKLLSVKFVYVKFVCVKLLYVKFVLFVCVLLRRRREEEAEKARDTESKTRTPHKDVGNKQPANLLALRFKIFHAVLFFSPIVQIFHGQGSYTPKKLA